MPAPVDKAAKDFQEVTVTFRLPSSSDEAMKSHSLLSASLLILVSLLFQPTAVHAQANRGGGARLSYLSADDRVHLMKVRKQVLESQPDLKTEQESLEKEWKFVKGKGTDATPEDKETLRNNFQAHNEKMNAAMLQADPSIAPVLDQVKAHRQAQLEQHAGAGGSSL
jgi:hypothetical protein